jgi:hypothetical protein
MAVTRCVNRNVLLATVLALASVVAACGSPTASTSTATPRAQATPALMSPPRTGSVSGLIASPRATFDVRFSWTDGAPSGGPIDYEWRQRDGIRRRDVRNGDSEGAFSIERDFADPPNDHEGRANLNCEWLHKQGDAVAGVSCRSGTPGSGISGSIENALGTAIDFGQLTRPLAGREIAGRSSWCYEFSALSTGEICVDASSIPLYFSGQFRPTTKKVTIEAISVSLDVSELDVTPDFPTAASYKGFADVPISDLHLPN